ncbi:type I secretion protein ATPase [Amylibacter sp. SFDW26]|uniref:type I secretion protein ATPase n=1 Tax=Amylibacter sp. SFDW26 TaxID=2652722 RepID=UPI0012615CAA|nr:type I secretion protein ATPase [Amylibacter sp. SFDW26]KAB7610157.1 type I secretion protein ATPase [Amylibacter sp. SFDW26]
MAFDATTEIVAHFVGVFDIAIENAKLRDNYDRLKALKGQEAEYEELNNITVNLKAPYTLKGYEPGLSPYASASVSDGNFHPPYSLYNNYARPDDFTNNIQTPEADDFYLTHPHSGHNTSFEFFLEPASSVVSIVYQTTFLEDNDILTFDGAVEFTDPSYFLNYLNELVLIASVIDGLEVPNLLSSDAIVHDEAIQLLERASEFETVALSGLTSTTLHGDAAYGIHINGETAENLPIIKDLLPGIFKKEETPDEDTENPLEAVFSEDTSLDFFDVDPGHAIVSGANQIVNQTSLATNWLDAPVISVMGDVISIEIINQLNILFNHDNGATSAETNVSHAFNMAEIKHEFTTPPVEEGTVDETTSEPIDKSLPTHWVVTTVDADLVAINWVQQYNFITDTDRAEIEFSGWETYIGLGENNILNTALLLEIGYGYDLIIIGGSMINISMINQVNIVLDSDNVTYTGIAPDNISTNDNLLLNYASLTSVGVDNYIEMTDPFANAAEQLADGAQTIGADVAQDMMFEGVDVLSVLYIDGDLTVMTMVEQSNILGDSDQVHLALDDFENTTGADVTVTTGSNATLNTAVVVNQGVDSTVMVQGEVYSDALIYQAELIDTDAVPLGVSTSDLTSEAVVFLSDEMAESPPITSEETVLTPTMNGGATTPDVMQTVLA